MKLAFTKSFDEAMQDNLVLERRTLVYRNDGKTYTVKMNEDGKFNYYLRRK